jgi:hypothetical protein
VAFNRNPRNVAGILDQLQVSSVRTTHFTIEDGEGAQDFTFGGE